MAIVTVDDLVSRWRPLTPTEEERAGILIDDATAFLKRTLNQADIDISDVDYCVIVMVICQVVKRAMLADDRAGLNSQQQIAGPFQELNVYANPAGDMYLTAGEKKLLGLRRQKLRSISPRIGDE